MKEVINPDDLGSHLDYNLDDLMQKMFPPRDETKSKNSAGKTKSNM